MWNGFIGECIAASSRNLRRWSIALFIVATLISLCYARELVNVRGGPNVSESYGNNLVPAGILAGVLLLFSLWTAIKSKRRSEHPETHPLCKALSQYENLDMLVPEIVLPFRNEAFEIRVLDWMVLSPYSETLDSGVERRPLGHRPGCQHSVYLQPKVVMQPARTMLLNHKDKVAPR